MTELKELIYESYNTHSKNTIQLCMRNTQLILNATKHLDVKTKNQVLILVSLHLNQKTYTGYYSIAFNNMTIEELYIYLLSINNGRIKTVEHKFFPELFDNDTLTSNEKKLISTIYIKEKERLTEIVNKNLNERPLEPLYFDLLPEEDYSTKIYLYLQSKRSGPGIPIITTVSDIKTFMIELATKTNMNKIYLQICIDKICQEYKIEKKIIDYSLSKR